MKNIFYILVSIITLVMLFIAGCQTSPAGPTNNNTGEIDIRLAPIHDVQVRMAESYPVQVFVYIKGGLADGCTTFNDLTVERIGNVVDITVTTLRPRGAICTQVYDFFERNVALGSDFTSGQTYTVQVNDMTTIFVMQ